MNERLQQLASKARIKDHWSIDEGRYLTNYLDEQKFAELIVLECVNAVMDGTKEGDHYAQRIEQQFDNGQGGILHFGVEE
jgi:hypothetical protein